MQQHAEAARELARKCEELERIGDMRQAAAVHGEASRLFRLASIESKVEREAQQMRMQARHHDGRARQCEEAAARVATPTVSVKEESTGVKEGMLLVDVDESGILEPPTSFEARMDASPPLPPPSASSGWMRAFEELWDTLFTPKRGDSPGSSVATVRPQLQSSEDTVNRMMESFLVLPDYKGTSAAAAAAPVNSSSSSNEAQSAATAELKDLVERLTRQNDALLARVAELEAERNVIKHSVMQFRDDLERGIRSDAGLVAPGLETLLDMEARSVLMTRRTPSPAPGPAQLMRSPSSPSPDLVEYIRTLERRVENQAQEIELLRSKKRQSRASERK